MGCNILARSICPKTTEALQTWEHEQCGWLSNKIGAEGSAEALNHARLAKKQDGIKHSCLLFDTDAQKPGGVTSRISGTCRRIRNCPNLFP